MTFERESKDPVLEAFNKIANISSVELAKIYLNENKAEDKNQARITPTQALSRLHRRPSEGMTEAEKNYFGQLSGGKLSGIITSLIIGFSLYDIYNLTMIAPNEKLLMQSMNNTQTLCSSGNTTFQEFVCQFMKYPQKLAIEMDEQSLTYSEFLYYVQLLSLYLLNEQNVIVGEIICQCVERSLSMVRVDRKDN